MFNVKRYVLIAVLANMVQFPALTRFRFTAIEKLLTNEVCFR